MKPFFPIVALALTAIAPLRAETPATPAPAAAAAPSPADQAYAAVFATFREGPANPKLREENPREYYRWVDEKMRKFVAAARAFAATYPHDPRRYEGLVQSSYTRPWFLVGFKPDFDAAPGEKNLLIDQAALNDFRATQFQYLAEVITAPDATDRQRGGATFAYLADRRADARDRGIAFDLAPLGALVDRVIARFPDERALPVVEQYRDALRQQSPAAAQAFEAKLQSVPTLAAALAAATAKRAAAAADKAKRIADLGSMHFTAADGREVSLAALKGKVVLVDFWATWCGPCKAEIPNVVANYAKYHARGFEVIGITLENSGVSPADHPEQRAAKLAKAKELMLAFTRDHHMPWPQYFDGLGWMNVYARQFAIDGIPAMFLLDQQGNIVSTEARGPALEAELKRLLKL